MRKKAVIKNVLQRHLMKAYFPVVTWEKVATQRFFDASMPSVLVHTVKFR